MIVVVLLVVLLPIIMAAVLYMMVSNLITGPPNSPLIAMDITQEGANWSVEFTFVSAGILPASTLLTIRNPQGGVSLSPTAFSALDPADWAVNRAAYDDRNPGIPEVQVHDRLLIERATYVAQSTIEVSAGTATFVTVLQ